MALSDKVILKADGTDGVTLYEALVIAFAAGGCTPEECIESASQVAIMLDRRVSRTRPKGVRLCPSATKRSDLA